MKNLFNMLNESAQKEAKPRSNFGDLVDKDTYHFEVIGASAAPNSNANPMLTLDTKTINGASGVGTKIKAWFTLDVDGDGNLVEGKEYQSRQLMQLVGALGVDISDIFADDYVGYMKEIAARIMEAPAKTFMAEVKARPDYTAANGKTYKQWALNQFSIQPIDAINTDTPTQTSAEQVKDQFSFDV